MLSRIFRWTLLTVAFAATSLAALEFKPVMELSLGTGYAGTAGTSGSWLGVGNLHAVPALRSGSFSVFPLAYANASGQERSIEEGTIFVRALESGLRPTVKWALAGPATLSLDLQALRTLNLETVNETWGRGLYDYEQYGLGAAYQHKLGSAGENAKLRLGYSHRSYPNNRNFQAAVAFTDNKNYYYKDFDALSLDLSAQLLRGALTLSYRPQQRNYSDSLVVRPNGTLDLGLLRQDWLHRVAVGLAAPMAPWLLGSVDLKLEFNDSNQNLLAQGIGPATYISNHLDYASESLDLGLVAELGRLWRGSRASLRYGISFLQTQRPVQRMDGTYLDEKEQGQTHSFALGFEKDMPWDLTWQSGADLSVYRSNQQLALGTRPNYEYWQLRTGFKYNFKTD